MSFYLVFLLKGDHMESGTFKFIGYGMTIILLLFSLPIKAQLCIPKLHGDVEIKSDNLLIKSQDGSFQIASNGDLFFDIHKVALDPKQRASLTAYNKTIRTDLPFIYQAFSQELKKSWLGLDKLFLNEFGQNSVLRRDFEQFHQHLQNQIRLSFYKKDNTPHFDHKKLTDTINELKISIPQLISSVSVRGLVDIAKLNINKENKIQLMSEKMQQLQDKLTNEVNKMVNRNQNMQKEVCSRLLQWQVQESNIANIIPALAQWKTVTIQ